MGGPIAGMSYLIAGFVLVTRHPFHRFPHDIHGGHVDYMHLQQYAYTMLIPVGLLMGMQHMRMRRARLGGLNDGHDWGYTQGDSRSIALCSVMQIVWLVIWREWFLRAWKYHDMVADELRLEANRYMYNGSDAQQQRHPRLAQSATLPEISSCHLSSIQAMDAPEPQYLFSFLKMFPHLSCCLRRLAWSHEQLHGHTDNDPPAYHLPKMSQRSPPAEVKEHLLSKSVELVTNVSRSGPILKRAQTESFRSKHETMDHVHLHGDKDNVRTRKRVIFLTCLASSIIVSVLAARATVLTIALSMAEPGKAGHMFEQMYFNPLRVCRPGQAVGNCSLVPWCSNAHMRDDDLNGDIIAIPSCHATNDTTSTASVADGNASMRLLSPSGGTVPLYHDATVV